jgi:hypothetical protein
VEQGDEPRSLRREVSATQVCCVACQNAAADSRTGISLVRLLPMLALDPTLGGGATIAGANLRIGNALSVQMMVGLQNDLLFAEGVS